METAPTLYSIALFLHIVGALGIFVALGLEWVGLSNLPRAATVEQARPWLSILSSPRRLYSFSSLAILIPGSYMASTAWGWAEWILLALGAMFLLAGIGIVFTGRRMSPIEEAVARESGPLSATLRQRLVDPGLQVSLWIRTAVALGIVFLMSVKPGLVGSLLTLTIAGILGLVFSLPSLRRNREQSLPITASDRL